MIRTANLGGLLILIYIWYQPWTISRNSGSSISSLIVNIIEFIPSYIITGVYLIVGILYIVSIVTNKLPKISKVLYVLSVCLISLISKVAVDILLLQDHTNTLAGIIHHTVPIEMKLYHFKIEIMEGLIASPEILTNKININTFQEVLGNHIDIAKLKQMNAREIHEHTLKIFNDYHNGQHSRTVEILNIIIKLGCCVGLAMFFKA